MNPLMEKANHNSNAITSLLLKIITLANLVIALTWLYHGIVPKLLFMETGELAMIQASGLFGEYEVMGVYAAGIGEIIFGLGFVFIGRSKIMHYLNIFSLLALGATAAVAKPEVYLQPFNPATTSFGVIGLSLIVLAILKYLPQTLKSNQTKN